MCWPFPLGLFQCSATARQHQVTGHLQGTGSLQQRSRPATQTQASVWTHHEEAALSQGLLGAVSPGWPWDWAVLPPPLQPAPRWVDQGSGTHQDGEKGKHTFPVYLQIHFSCSFFFFQFVSFFDNGIENIITWTDVLSSIPLLVFLMSQSIWTKTNFLSSLF